MDSNFTFDLGSLAVFDLTDRKGELVEKTKSTLQALTKQYFDIAFTEASSGQPVGCIRLPKPSTRYPRHKPVPKLKEKTKWEKFAEVKGIKKHVKRGGKVYDENHKEWVPRHGAKSARNDKMAGWCEEVQ